ncbi:MAG: hypothetical protein AAFQ24_14380, partial [Pseudomonadota bacterium]
VDHSETAALMKANRPAPAAATADPASPQPAAASPAPSGRKSRKTQNKSVQDWVAEAEAMAADAGSLEALKAAIEQFEGCPLKQLCEKTVVYDGSLTAPVMVLGEGP